MFKISLISSLILSINCNFLFDNYNCLYDNAYKSLGETCKLSDDHEGVCKELNNCESAKKLFSKKEFSKIQHCGFKGIQRLVCCPRSNKFVKALCKTENPQGVPGPYFRITNGNVASPGEFPFQAALGRRSLDGEIKFYCGGTLITDNVILTASHCFNKETTAPTMARLGRISLDLADLIDENEAVDVEFESVIGHPKYNSLHRQNDIALIKLKTPVEYTHEIKPICLSSNDSERPKNLTITGYGSTQPGLNTKSAQSKLLLKGFVYDYPQEDCKKAYKENGRELIDGQYCANSFDGTDSCSGDSGGALSYEFKNGAYYQYGIISYGASCGSSFPAIYTKVNKYLDWISDEMLKFES